MPDVAQIVERLSGRLQVAGARPAVWFGKWEKAKICIDNEIMFCNLKKEQVKELSDSIDEYKKNFVKEMDEKIIEYEELRQKIINNDVEDLINNVETAEATNAELLKKYFC